VELKSFLRSESISDIHQPKIKPSEYSAQNPFLLRISAIAIAGALITPLSAQAQVVNLLENGGFEQQLPQQLPTPTRYMLLPEDNIPAWKTSANDKLIEIWTNGFNGVNTITSAQSAAAGDDFFPSGGGSFFNEINATQHSSLSQTVTLKTNGLLSYSFWTRGRNGTDTMKVEVQKLVNGSWTSLHADTYSTSNKDWANYAKSKFLIVEAGQQYRFAFTSVSSVGGDKEGNFLDNAAIGFLDTTPAPEPPPNPFVPDPPLPVAPGQPAPPAPPAPPLDLTADQAEDILAETIGAGLEPEAVASGFFLSLIHI
jgi:hypothetical protein